MDPDNYTFDPPWQELGCTRVSAPESYTYAGQAQYYHSWDYVNGGSGSYSLEAQRDSNGIWDDPDGCLPLVDNCDHGEETLTYPDAKTRKYSWFNTTSDENGWEDCYGYSQATLEDEYTTEELIQRLADDLSVAEYSSWYSGSATASFHLTSPYHKCGTASKFKARIRACLKIAEPAHHANLRSWMRIIAIMIQASALASVVS